MTKTYVLTEGCYSEYHIVGVYSTQELAQEAQSLYPYSDIEEFDLDNIPEHPPGMKAWGMVFVDGKLNDNSRQISPNTESFPSEKDYTQLYDGKRIYRVYCWARDKDHAEKIALDKYYQHQATKAGLT